MASAVPATALSPALEAILSTVHTCVSEKLTHMDASHDMSHVDRVHALALRIAHEEGVADPKEIFLIRAAALLHDVDDHKYSGSDDVAKASVGSILARVGVEPEDAATIQSIIAAVSFHSELAGASSTSLLAQIVQDADRLEAVGAIGIARCLTYGGAKHRPLYDSDTLSPEWRERVAGTSQMSPSEYAAYSATSVGHFYAKLLRLKELMKTRTGRKLAEQRHVFMEGFLEQLFAEIAGER